MSYMSYCHKRPKCNRAKRTYPRGYWGILSLGCLVSFYSFHRRNPDSQRIPTSL